MKLFDSTNRNLVSLTHKTNPTLCIRYVSSAGKLQKIWEQQEGKSERERTRLPLGTSASIRMCQLFYASKIYQDFYTVGGKSD